MSEAAIETAAALMKEPGKFSVRDHLNGSSHVTESVAVFIDGQAGWEIERLDGELAKAEARLRSEEYNDGGLVESDGYADAKAEVDALNAELRAALKKAYATRLTFFVRGVPYKQLELIFKKARKAIKPPARKNFAQDADGEEEYELEVLERNIERNDLINYLTIAAAIVKVVDAEGNEDTSAWDADAVENLRTNLYGTEYTKIKNLVDTVTMAQGIFTSAAERDADFLSKR
jgi:hypothetical protein